MILNLTKAAVKDFDTIFNYISENDVDAAQGIASRIHIVLKMLTFFPRIGKVSAVEGTREYVISDLPYV
jgi:plasmid stabilization system protein ParE